MEINLMELEPRHAHDLLTSAIIPRPIAWVSTMNKDGWTNLAPFSFFTGVSWSPPVLAFSVVNRADGTLKDTAKKHSRGSGVCGSSCIGGPACRYGIQRKAHPLWDR